MFAKVKVGVFGGRRGQTMIDVLSKHPDAELAAICDFSEYQLQKCKDLAESAGSNVTCYSDFDKFFEHDMDAVVLANYATEHVPYAIRLLDSGRHVLSELLACHTLSEAVQLVEAVERNNKIYAYAENCCYLRTTMEMRRIYESGALGEFLHGEGEYVHDCESIWVDITYGQRDHWRNWMSSTYYCTHAIGPIVTITGTRPVRITAFETPNVNKSRVGCRSADGSIIVCQMSNGATAKFLPCAMFKREPSLLSYAVYGSKGMAETDRWGEAYDKLNVYLEEKGEVENYKPEFPFETELSKSVGGHGGSDFFTMDFFLDAILERQGKEYLIDVYSALDMTLPGIFAYSSILDGNMPKDIPDFRDKLAREKYRNDNWSLAPGNPDGLECSCSFGPVDIPDSLYAEQAAEWNKRIQKN